jgi:hypothetical protein
MGLFCFFDVLISGDDYRIQSKHYPVSQGHFFSQAIFIPHRTADIFFCVPVHHYQAGIPAVPYSSGSLYGGCYILFMASVQHGTGIYSMALSLKKFKFYHHSPSLFHLFHGIHPVDQKVPGTDEGGEREKCHCVE